MSNYTQKLTGNALTEYLANRQKRKVTGFVGHFKLHDNSAVNAEYQKHLDEV